MGSKKQTSQELKKKWQRLELELEKLKEQKRLLYQKEKTLNKQLTETKATYLVSLVTESNKSIEEVERFAKGESNRLEDAFERERRDVSYNE